MSVVGGFVQLNNTCDKTNIVLFFNDKKHIQNAYKQTFYMIQQPHFTSNIFYRMGVNKHFFKSMITGALYINQNRIKF